MRSFRSPFSWRQLLYALVLAMLALPQSAHAQTQTLVICKQASVTDGTLFTFNRANGSGTLPGFSLNNGGCTTFDLTNADHFNKISENVPSGWTLTNIVCVHQAHSAVNISGADPNALFQPGDTTVSVDLSDANVTCTFYNTKGQGLTGQLKICKVAGPGVAVHDPFIFNPGGITVPAGPAPGGYCVLGPALVIGSSATVTEALPSGVTVTAIVAAPPGQLVSSNLAAGSATVTIAYGVTEVTFTNEKHTGWLEICKRGPVSGDFTFTVSGVPGTITVPAGACSPAMELPAGPVTIHENPAAGSILWNCTALPPANFVNCSAPSGVMNVTIVPGNVSTQTVALFTNQ